MLRDPLPPQPPRCRSQRSVKSPGHLCEVGPQCSREEQTCREGFISWQWVKFFTDDPLHHVVHLPGLLLLSPPSILDVEDDAPHEADRCRQRHSTQLPLEQETRHNRLLRRVTFVPWRFCFSHQLKRQRLCWCRWETPGGSGKRRAYWDVWTPAARSRWYRSQDLQVPVQSACRDRGDGRSKSKTVETFYRDPLTEEDLLTWSLHPGLTG